MENILAVPASEVVAVVDHLEQAGITYQINGGWGVDALIGEETRLHQDLDLFIDGAHFEPFTEWLTERGYQLFEDWLPAAQEWVSGNMKIDVHPMVLDDEGNGHQSGEHAKYFFHPADGRTTGTIGGRTVVCATVEHQERMHRGYTPRDKDLLDLITLERLKPSGFPTVTLTQPVDESV